jgi:C4-dicarboxylate transporter DctQ subunit
VATAFGFDWPDLTEGPTSPDLEWPVWIFYLAVPLGSYLMCFRFLQVCWSFVRTGELPHHDHAHVDGLEEEMPVDATEALEEYEEHKFDQPGRTGGEK